MAIVVEEGKKSGILRIVGWISIILILCAAVYYVFFAAPEVVVIPTPANFQYVAPLAQVTLHPEDVLNSPGFQALKPPSFALPTPKGPAAVGRTNPLLPL